MINNNFTEYEWLLVTLCPVSSAHAVVFSDLGSKVESEDTEIIPKDISNTIKKSMEKELIFINSNITKYIDKYPSSELVKAVLKDIGEKSIEYLADRLSKLSGIIENYPFKDEHESELSKLDDLMEEIGLEGNNAELIKIANLSNLGYAMVVLNKKGLPASEIQEFKEFIYRLALDVANEASESFFGYGKKISEKEKVVLGYIKRILDWKE